MLAVVQRRIVSAEPHVAWSHLTEPRLVSDWFAEVHALGPGQPFRFDFGDGDFFTGNVVTWRAPEVLELAWRFMGAGPRFEIRYTVRPHLMGSEVEVRDRGASTPEEAAALAEGWSDFLERLATIVRTGRPARYRWSPSIGAGAVLHARPETVMAALRDQRWWRSAFPEAHAKEIRDAEAPGKLVVVLADEAWGERRTVVTVDAREGADDDLHLNVVHSGWEQLEEERQVAERRRYAESWAQALQGLEKRHPSPPP